MSIIMTYATQYNISANYYTDSESTFNGTLDVKKSVMSMPIKYRISHHLGHSFTTYSVFGRIFTKYAVQRYLCKCVIIIMYVISITVLQA